jgi:O-antigen/teichoic acid export membrane protein
VPSTDRGIDSGDASPRLRVALSWGLLTQVCTSACNLALSVLAGRLLGPSGLGSVFVGFAAFQLALNLQRAAVTQPIVNRAAVVDPTRRLFIARAGMTTVLATSGALGIVMAAIGLAVDGGAARGLLLFAPWMVPGLLQEYWKAMLFADRRGAVAAAAEAARATTMALAAALVWASPSDYAVVTAWGAAAAVALVIAVAARPLRPLSHIREVVVHVVGDRLGRWLGAREIVYQASAYATVLALAGIVGSDGLGGLRAAEVLFSPFSLVASAMVLPALPALSLAAARSAAAARGIAIKITVVSTAFAVAYFIVMAVGGEALLSAVFGESFDEFAILIWPMGMSQLIGASAFAFALLLIAERRGRASFVVGIVSSASTLLFPIVLAIAYGTTGAAWGYAVASAATVIPLALFTVKIPSASDRRLKNLRVSDD